MKTLSDEQVVRIFDIIADYLEGQYAFVKNPEYPQDARDAASLNCDAIEALSDFLIDRT